MPDVRHPKMYKIHDGTPAIFFGGLLWRRNLGCVRGDPEFTTELLKNARQNVPEGTVADTEETLVKPTLTNNARPC